MSNVLAPFLTGATRHAEHYVAVLVGLRWAKRSAKLPIDRLIWPQFEIFERGLKQYWHLYPGNRPARRRYLGKREIAKICGGKRPDVFRQILQDQRGIGLLANYIESIRAIGLVRRGQLVIEDAAVEHLLGDPRFEWSGSNPRTWAELRDIFENVDTARAWPRLGERLFALSELSDERARMNSAAKSVLGSPNADWPKLAKVGSLLETQRRVAQATGPTAELEEHLRDSFTALLEGGQPRVSPSEVRKLAQLARHISRLHIIDSVWPRESTLARALKKQVEGTAQGRFTTRALLQWHLDIMGARGTEPWILELGDRSALRLPTQRDDPDFRLSNLRTLLQETRWVG